MHAVSTITSFLTCCNPFKAGGPTTEEEFNNLQMSLRRMGHILESSPGNVATQLRQTPTAAFFMGGATDGGWSSGGADAAGQDPWANGADPWSTGGAYAAAPQQASAANNASWGTGGAYAAVPQQTGAGSYVDSGTDSDTVSSLGETLFDEADLVGLTTAQRTEHLFWSYQQGKSRWRRHMQKPTRRVRRFLKRDGHKGSMKGKGKQRFSFLENVSYESTDNVFFGGKAAGKGKKGNHLRSTGKGKGRKRAVAQRATGGAVAARRGRGEGGAQEPDKQ